MIKNKDLQNIGRLPTTTDPRTRLERNPTCWRYMDLLSLLSILHKGAIHFTHIRELYKYDPQEGTGGLQIELINTPITPKVIAVPSNSRIDEKNRIEIKRIESILSVPISDQIPEFKKRVKQWDKENKTIYVSAWHFSEIDSDFMWRIYGKYEYGFAVVSSVQDLVYSFTDAGIDFDKLGFGAVIYPTRDKLIRDNLLDVMGSFGAFMIKSPQYSQEREFRVFVKAKKLIKSCDISINLQKLVHSIQISPLVPQWAVQPLLDTINPICTAKGLPRIESPRQSLRRT
jgi:hypothetical protein